MNDKKDESKEVKETAVVTMTDVTDKLKDKVRAMLLDSIPDEAIEDMIRAEFKKFFNTETLTTRYSSPSDGDKKAIEVKTSPFGSIVHEMIKEHIMGQLKSKIWEFISASNGEWAWENASCIVKSLVQGMIPDIQRSQTEQLIKDTLSNMQNSGIFR